MEGLGFIFHSVTLPLEQPTFKSVQQDVKSGSDLPSRIITQKRLMISTVTTSCMHRPSSCFWTPHSQPPPPHPPLRPPQSSCPPPFPSPPPPNHHVLMHAPASIMSSSIHPPPPLSSCPACMHRRIEQHSSPPGQYVTPFLELPRISLLYPCSTFTARPVQGSNEVSFFAAAAAYCQNILRLSRLSFFIHCSTHEPHLPSPQEG